MSATWEWTTITLGPMAALDAISRIVPDRPVHGVGYCLGGTLLAASAAAMARDGDKRLKTLSLLAAQTDLSEAGELTLFISEGQVAYLEDIMWEQGYLDAGQMAGAFRMLRSNDLIWSRVVRDYLMGDRQPISDMMAWDADATGCPIACTASICARCSSATTLPKAGSSWRAARWR